MLKINIIDFSGNKKETTFDSKLIIENPNKQAIFDSILAENAGKRQGTHSTKTKAEVRGGGRKPWRQKHTGKSRQGSIRSPQWVGGGVAFGPKPTRNYEIKINKKVRKLAFRSAFTNKYHEQGLMLLKNDCTLDKPSTKKIAELVKKLLLTDKKILFIVNDSNINFIKSCSNIQKIESKLWNQVSTRDLVNSVITIVQEDALNRLSEVFA